MRVSLVLVFAFALAGCAPTYLTTKHHYKDQIGFMIDEEARIADSVGNREVLDIMIQYRDAMVRKDFGTIKRLVSKRYYDNGGTTKTTKDDYGSDQLPEVYEAMAQHADQIKYKIKVKSVDVRDKVAYIDYEYEYAYQYKVGDESSWDAGIEINRLELVPEDGEWKILSGL